MGVKPMWAEDLEKLAEDWAAEVEAGAKPSLPHLTDEWEPTNANLWQTVLEVAAGKRREFTSGDRTIHAPNEGLGFHPWPHPKGIAWAVKQYNGFGGHWERKESPQTTTAAARLNGEIIPDAVPMGDYQYRSVRDLVPGRRKEPKNPPRGERVRDLVEDTEAKNETAEEVDESWQESAPPIDPKKQQAEADRATKQAAETTEEWVAAFVKRHPALRKFMPKRVLDKAQGDSLHGEARQHGDEVWLTPKFWKLDSKTREYVFTHELGHYVRSRHSLMDLVNLASSLGIDPWETSSLPFGQPNMEEAFADAFATYYLSKGELKSRYPQWVPLVEQMSKKATTCDPVLNLLRLGAVIETRTGQDEHQRLSALQKAGLAQGEEHNGRTYWNITRAGSLFVVASLGGTLQQKMNDLLEGGDYDLAKAKALGKWFGDNFRTQSPRTPRGQKDLKTKAEALRWYLTHGSASYADSVRSTWKQDIEPHLTELVQYFTDEGGQVVPKELMKGSITYENDVGVSQAVLEKYVDRLEAIFDKLKGWHARALKGNLTVVLASPKNFSGTAGGKYKHSEGGKLLVRATPTVLRRTGDSYGSLEYILIHELGHRFEYKNRLPMDFDKPEWWTTKYSRKEGEAFAELFALSHFKLHGPWDNKVVERFQKLMSGQGDISKPELPEHLRALV